MHAIAVGKNDKLIPTIETVIAAVEAGELDAVLAQMSKTANRTSEEAASVAEAIDAASSNMQTVAAAK